MAEQKWFCVADSAEKAWTLHFIISGALVSFCFSQFHRVKATSLIVLKETRQHRVWQKMPLMLRITKSGLACLIGGFFKSEEKKKKKNSREQILSWVDRKNYCSDLRKLECKLKKKKIFSRLPIFQRSAGGSSCCLSFWDRLTSCPWMSPKE